MDPKCLSRITVSKTGQVVTTIPKQIAGAMRFRNGEKVEWIFDRGDLIIRPHKE